MKQKKYTFGIEEEKIKTIFDKKSLQAVLDSLNQINANLDAKTQIFLNDFRAIKEVLENNIFTLGTLVKIADLEENIVNKNNEKTPVISLKPNANDETPKLTQLSLYDQALDVASVAYKELSINILDFSAYKWNQKFKLFILNNNINTLGDLAQCRYKDLRDFNFPQFGIELIKVNLKKYGLKLRDTRGTARKPK